VGDAKGKRGEGQVEAGGGRLRGRMGRRGRRRSGAERMAVAKAISVVNPPIHAYRLLYGGKNSSHDSYPRGKF
jgi:hypothetical protein